MKTNKFNLSQLKGYCNDFTYKVKLKGFNEEGDQCIDIYIFNPNGAHIATYSKAYHGKRSFKKHFHRHIKELVSEMYFYIKELIDENYFGDNCFTKSEGCNYL